MTLPDTFPIPPELPGLLASARKLVVFTGAGVSAESGISTFRDRTTGLWARFDPQQLATPEAFRVNPPLVWGWYEARRRSILNARPNPAHIALARFGELLPEVVVVTQNVDDLHERAGSHPVLHLHGRLDEARCFRCDRPYRHPGPPPPEAGEAEITPPTCEACGHPIRPGVVWFGESLPHDVWSQVLQHVNECDALFCVGTSAVVCPAAEIPLIALSRGATVVQVNPQPTELDARVRYNLHGKAGEVLPALFEAVRQHEPERQ